MVFNNFLFRNILGDFLRKRNRSFFQIFRNNPKDFPCSHKDIAPDSYPGQPPLKYSPAGLIQIKNFSVFAHFNSKIRDKPDSSHCKMLLPCGENFIHAIKEDGALNFPLVQYRPYIMGSCTYFDLRHTVSSFRKQSYVFPEKCKGELFENS